MKKIRSKYGLDTLINCDKKCINKEKIIDDSTDILFDSVCSLSINGVQSFLLSVLKYLLF